MQVLCVQSNSSYSLLFKQKLLGLNLEGISHSVIKVKRLLELVLKLERIVGQVVARDGNAFFKFQGCVQIIWFCLPHLTIDI